jgi:protoporphyrinogen oxidase
LERVRNHADIRLQSPVESIERRGEHFVVRTAAGEFRAPRIINTLPLEVFQGLPKNFPFSSQVGYQSAVCGIFVVREKPTSLYWTNVIDPDIPFKVLVNQSCLDDYPGTVLYCGNYLRASDDFYQLGNEAILDRYQAGLGALFGDLTVVARRVFRARYATPIFDRNFSRHTADLDRCVPGMTFAGNIKVYPHGRTLNNVLLTGRAAAQAILAGVSGRP